MNFRKDNPQQKITVYRGNPNASTWIVGKSPGLKDGQDGIPFNYGSGDLLEKIVIFIGLEWLTDCLLINPVFCADCTDEGVEKTPTVSEMESCSIWFDALVKKSNVQHFLALGSVAHRALTGRSETMSEVSGHDEPFPSRFDGKPVWTIYHPAYLLRNPPGVDEARKQVVNTVKAFRSTLNVGSGVVKRVGEAGKEMGITPARASQINATVLRKLRWTNQVAELDKFLEKDTE